jgi:hypothetical protein
MACKATKATCSTYHNSNHLPQVYIRAPSQTARPLVALLAARLQGRWLFVGRDPCYPPSPEHREDPGVLFDEVERVVLLKVTALIADNLQGRSSTSKHNQWSDLDEQRIQEGMLWDWIFGKLPGRILAGVRMRWTVQHRNKLPPRWTGSSSSPGVSTCPLASTRMND